MSFEFNLNGSGLFGDATLKHQQGRKNRTYNPSLLGNAESTISNSITKSFINKNYDMNIYSIYPIPTKEKLSISGLKDNEEIQVLLYDIYGKKIQTYQVTNANPNISFLHLSDGMYLIYIEKNGVYIQSNKLIVNND